MSQPLPEQNTLNLDVSSQKNEKMPNQASLKQNDLDVVEWVCVYADAQFYLTTKTQYEPLSNLVQERVQEGNQKETYEIVENEEKSKQESKQEDKEGVDKRRKNSIGCMSVISRQCKTEINELRALRVKIQAQKQLIDEEIKKQNQTVNFNKRRELNHQEKSSTIFVIRQQKEKRGKSLRKFTSNTEKSLNGSDHSFESKNKKKYRNSFMIAPHELSSKWSEDKSRAVQQSFASEKKENSIKYKIDGHRMLERETNLQFEKPDVLTSEKDSKIKQKSFTISSKRPTSRSRSITNSFRSNRKQDNSNCKSSLNPPEDYKNLNVKLKQMQSKLKAVQKKQKKLQQIERIMKDEAEKESQSSKVKQPQVFKYKDKSELSSKPSIVSQQKAVQQQSESSEKDVAFEVYENEKIENKVESAPKKKSFSIKNAFSTKNELSKSIQKKLGLTSLTVNYNLSEQMMKVRMQQQEMKNKQKLEQEVVELKRTIRQLKIEKIKQQDIIKTLQKEKQQGNCNNSKLQKHHPQDSFDFTRKEEAYLSASGRTQKFPYSDNGNKIIAGSDQKRQSRLYSSIVKNIPNNSETTETKRRESPEMEFPNTNIENDQILSSQIKGIKRRGLIVRQILNHQKLANFSKQLNTKEGDGNVSDDKKLFDDISDLNVEINQNSLKQKAQKGASQNQDAKLLELNKDSDKPKQNPQVKTLFVEKQGSVEATEQNKSDQHEQKVNEFEKPIIQVPQVEVLQSIAFPTLPKPPSIQSTFNEVLEKVKTACQITQTSFGKKEEIQMKKFKNCIILKQNETDKAIVWHFSGKFYNGGWNQTTSKEDSKNGDGYEFVPEKYFYRGSFGNGRRNGLGIMISANGSIYKGEWSQGEKNGQGTFQDKSIGCIYVGSWKDGKKEGKGILKKSDKQFYVGEFQKSLKSGNGKQVFSNGDVYEGQYMNGRFDGKGKYFWANESMYVGEFKNGQREGLGKWKSNYLNGDIYIGPYSKDKKQGEGRYQWDNGCIYEGGFSKDMKSGYGKMSYGDGRRVQGMWENGKMIEVIKKCSGNEQKGAEEDRK